MFFRDIYYSDVVFFGSQSVIDEIIDNLACMLKVPRHCLHVVSVTHWFVKVIHNLTRVRTGHGKPGKSWNLRISFSRPGKSWHLIVGPGKS